MIFWHGFIAGGITVTVIVATVVAWSMVRMADKTDRQWGMK